MSRVSDDDRDVFPFFVSDWRSGSTLLRSMFDSHPELAIPGESYFITRLLPRLSIYTANGFDAARFIDDVIELNWTSRIVEPTWIDRWGIDRSILREAVINAQPSDYSEATRSVFRCYADWKGKKLYGDKTPLYITEMEKILALLPEARFVHLIRDGRDVALAIRDAPFGPNTIEEIALHWRARVLNGRKAGRRMGIHRYMELHYEELISHPAVALKRVCDWLGLSFGEEMLDHRDSARNLGLEFGTIHQSVLKPIQKGIRDWRRQMHESEVEIFELIASDALDAFGYERAMTHPSMRKRARVAAKRCLLTGKKVSRRMRGLSSADWW